MPSLLLELRPSPRLLLALAALAALGVLAVLLSALPRALGVLPPLLAAASAWRLQRLPRGRLSLHAGGQAEWWPQPQGAAAAPEPLAAEPVGLESRGPLKMLSLRLDGRMLRWPLASDTLPPAQARALRLWLDRHAQPAAGDAAPPTS